MQFVGHSEGLFFQPVAGDPSVTLCHKDHGMCLTNHANLNLFGIQNLAHLGGKHAHGKWLVDQNCTRGQYSFRRQGCICVA